MLTVHHLEYSQSIRLLWLLEELGADYTLKLYARDPETMLAPDEYKALSPLGTAPVMTDGDLVLAESNAIIDHILDGHDLQGRLRPAIGDARRTRYLFWFHAAQGSMMPMLTFDTVFAILTKRVPFLIRPLIGAVLKQASAALIRPRMDALLRQAEKDLATAPWFAGETLTAADIVMSYCMEAAEARGYITNATPHCKAWLGRMRAHPSFRAAMAKDGKGSVVLDV